MSTKQLDRSLDLRERILDATLQVIRERGMAGTRTSAIARTAGCAEGSIYRYFSGKPELLREVVRTRLPGLVDLLPPVRAGSGTVAASLLRVAEVAASYYRDVAPIVAADIELCTGADLGAQPAADAIVAYLEDEQELGRVRADAHPGIAARLLLSTCLGESFCARDHEPELRALVELVARDLEPR